MRRRRFIEYFGAAASAPVVARAQGERVRSVGILIGGDEEYEARLTAVVKTLRDRGWVEGKNLRLIVAKPAEIRRQAADLAASAPDVILTTGSSYVGPLMRATRTVPIVFTSMVDPVGAGAVESLTRPGGNVTGFMLFDYSLSGKWLELLKQITPGLRRAAVIRDAETSSGIGQFAVIQPVAPALGIEVTPINTRDAGEIERAIEALAHVQNSGLVVATGTRVLANAKLITALAAKHRLTAVYPRRAYAELGGLCSYGPDVVELSKLGAAYATFVK